MLREVCETEDCCASASSSPTIVFCCVLQMMHHCLWVNGITSLHPKQGPMCCKISLWQHVEWKFPKYPILWKCVGPIKHGGSMVLWHGHVWLSTEQDHWCFGVSMRLLTEEVRWILTHIDLYSAHTQPNATKLIGCCSQCRWINVLQKHLKTLWKQRNWI